MGHRPARAVKPDPTVVAGLPVLDAKLPLGRALRVLVHADPTLTAMNTLRRHFEMVLGVPITSRAVSIDRLRAEIIANSRRSVSNYDLVACDLPWFGEMAQANRFIPLDAVSSTLPLDAADIYPDALASSRVGGRQLGVPIMTTAELLVYRTDILGEAGVEPPRTTLTLTRSAAKTAPVGISEFTNMYGTQWGSLTAAATVTVAPILVATMVLRRRLVEGLTFGAVK
jgi:multiple sugar transport system substrate-binding protein